MFNKFTQYTWFMTKTKKYSCKPLNPGAYQKLEEVFLSQD